MAIPQTRRIIQMSAIERWRGGIPARNSRRGELSPHVQAKLERWLGHSLPPPPAPQRSRQLPPPETAPVPLYEYIPAPVMPEFPREFELPRMCAIFDRRVMARYVRQPDGPYRYTGSYFLEDRHKAHFGPDSQFRLPVDFRPGQEQCACGSHSPGSCGGGGILCSQCGMIVCFGRTIPGEFFQCRDSCGHKAPVGGTYKENFGLVPRLTPWAR
jgi:hypothetical protein